PHVDTVAIASLNAIFDNCAVTRSVEENAILRHSGSRALHRVIRDRDARWPGRVRAAAEGVSVDPNAREKAVLHLIAADEDLGRRRVDRDRVSGPNQLVVRDRDPFDVGDDDAADPVVDAQIPSHDEVQARRRDHREGGEAVAQEHRREPVAREGVRLDTRVAQESLFREDTGLALATEVVSPDAVVIDDGRARAAAIQVDAVGIVLDDIEPNAVAGERCARGDAARRQQQRIRWPALYGEPLERDPVRFETDAPVDDGVERRVRRRITAPTWLRRAAL